MQALFLKMHYAGMIFENAGVIFESLSVPILPLYMSERLSYRLWEQSNT